MIPSTRASVAARLLKNLNLRFPTLVLILGLLTLIDLFIPDFIPFIDEIGLAILTLLFGMWKNRNPVNSPGGDSEEGKFTP
ncbi:MAG: hypothetical protein JXA73_10020 [Acidobacteria bacterium]|nr:hypothetical protein [Acidobacteriota bacterium]